MQTLKSNICEIKMDLLSEEDTTKNVVKVIELEEPVKQKKSEGIPKWFADTFKEFAGGKEFQDPQRPG